MSSMQCFPWVNMYLCLIHWCFQKDLPPWLGHACGRHRWLRLWNWAWGSGRLSGSCLLGIWLWFLVFPKKTGPGDSSAWCNVFFLVLQKPQAAEQIPVSHRLPEKSMFPSFWAAESSEMLFPLTTSLWRGSSYDQACCTAWGSTHRSAWGVLWQVPGGAMHPSSGSHPPSVDHQEKVYQVLKPGCWR